MIYIDSYREVGDGKIMLTQHTRRPDPIDDFLWVCAVQRANSSSGWHMTGYKRWEAKGAKSSS